MGPALSKRTDSSAAVHNREVTSLPCHAIWSDIFMLQHEACSIMGNDISTELTEVHANCSLVSGKEFRKNITENPLRRAGTSQQCWAPSTRKWLVLLAKKQHGIFPLSYKNRSPLITRIHCSVSLQREKVLHFSSCKYVGEKVNIFPALTSLPFCLRERKRVAFLPEGKLESYLISTSSSLFLYVCTFKKVILSSVWSWDQGSQIHGYTTAG